MLFSLMQSTSVQACKVGSFLNPKHGQRHERYGNTLFSSSPIVDPKIGLVKKVNKVATAQTPLSAKTYLGYHSLQIPYSWTGSLASAV